MSEGRYIKAHITFEFDRNFINDENESGIKINDRDFAEYARFTFIDDIYQLVKMNELGNAVSIDFIEEEVKK